MTIDVRVVYTCDDCGHAVSARAASTASDQPEIAQSEVPDGWLEIPREPRRHYCPEHRKYHAHER